jgi:hypothetical protein
MKLSPETVNEIANSMYSAKHTARTLGVSERSVRRHRVRDIDIDNIPFALRSMILREPSTTTMQQYVSKYGVTPAIISAIRKVDSTMTISTDNHRVAESSIAAMLSKYVYGCNVCGRQ